MPSSPSSSAQAARQRLADQLRQMRRDVGLTGREFARRAGWRDATLVSMVEKARRRVITADHVHLWCRICEAPREREAELLTEQATAERMWVSLRELHQVRRFVPPQPADVLAELDVFIGEPVLPPHVLRRWPGDDADSSPTHPTGDRFADQVGEAAPLVLA